MIVIISDPTLNNNDVDGDGQSSCDGDCDDHDPNVNDFDNDGDGLRNCGGDCNDKNEYVFLGTDLDGDGYLGCDDDCDDASMFIHPFGRFVNDGIDQDCDGSDLQQMISTGSELLWNQSRWVVFMLG